MTKEDVFCHIIKLHKLSTIPNLSFDNIVANEIPLISDFIYNQVKNGKLEIFNEIPYSFYLKNDITDLYTPNETYLNFLMKLDKSDRILSVELKNFIVSKALKNNLDKSNLDAFDIDKNFKKYINFFDVILKNIKSYEINLSIIFEMNHFFFEISFFINEHFYSLIEQDKINKENINTIFKIICFNPYVSKEFGIKEKLILLNKVFELNNKYENNIISYNYEEIDINKNSYIKTFFTRIFNIQKDRNHHVISKFNNISKKENIKDDYEECINILNPVLINQIENINIIISTLKNNEINKDLIKEIYLETLFYINKIYHTMNINNINKLNIEENFKLSSEIYKQENNLFDLFINKNNIHLFNELINDNKSNNENDSNTIFYFINNFNLNIYSYKFVNKLLFSDDYEISKRNELISLFFKNHNINMFYINETLNENNLYPKFNLNSIDNNSKLPNIFSLNFNLINKKEILKILKNENNNYYTLISTINNIENYSLKNQKIIKSKTFELFNSFIKTINVDKVKTNKPLNKFIKCFNDFKYFSTISDDEFTIDKSIHIDKNKYNIKEAIYSSEKMEQFSNIYIIENFFDNIVQIGINPTSIKNIHNQYFLNNDNKKISNINHETLLIKYLIESNYNNKCDILNKYEDIFGKKDEEAKESLVRIYNEYVLKQNKENIVNEIFNKIGELNKKYVTTYNKKRIKI